MPHIISPWKRSHNSRGAYLHTSCPAFLKAVSFQDLTGLPDNKKGKNAIIEIEQDNELKRDRLQNAHNWRGSKVTAPGSLKLCWSPYFSPRLYMDKTPPAGESTACLEILAKTSIRWPKFFYSFNSLRFLIFSEFVW